LGAGLILYSGTALAAVGDITEYAFPTAGYFSSYIAAGPDGNLWFTETLAGFGNGLRDKVVKMTTSGSFTEYPLLRTESHPRGIAVGPDGNLWVAESGGIGTVSKVTTSGAVTEYSIPTIFSDPQGIAAGPDGKLWFTESSGNKVATMTTSGAVTEYDIPTASSAPLDITAGPDGNLWFTELNQPGRVGKVTTAGVVTEYRVPSANASVAGITAGPDGNVWFAESPFIPQKVVTAASNAVLASDMVAKVTPAGVFTEYPVPTANAFPSSITAGRDGNLWITESGVNKVARVTTAGAITEYNVPTANVSPGGIAAGPDGNVWFIETTGTYPNFLGKVARVVTGSTIASPSPSPSASPSPFASGVRAANVTPHIGLPRAGASPLVPPRPSGWVFLGVIVLGALSVGAVLTASFSHRT
jgi:virginiamycin B lyase